MWAFLGRIFGSDKAIEKSIDTVAAGLDKLIYTDEEKADDARQSRTEARSMFIEWVRNSQGQNIARRFLALLIAFTWLSQYFMAQLFSLMAVWADPVQIDGKLVTDPRLTTSAEIVSQNAEAMSGAMMLILGFYFAAPHLGRIVDGAMSRFGKAAGGAA